MADTREWQDTGFVCPVADDELVELKFRCGEAMWTGVPQEWRWTETGDDYDIVAYRLPPAPQEKG